MGTFYNYLFKDCMNENIIYDVKFYSWTGSTGGGEDRLDIDEIWHIQDYNNSEIYGCYTIIDRYLGDEYTGNERITKSLVGDDFTFINYKNCEECEKDVVVEEYESVVINNTNQVNTIFVHIPN